MKKTILMAVAILMGATATTATAAKKNKKEKKEPAPVEMKLANATDSLSYALGKAQTRGLKDYLTLQLKVDTAYMADLIAGIQAAANNTDARQRAYNAGITIGEQIGTMMVDGLNKQFFEGDTVNSLQKDKFVAGFISGVDGSNGLISLDNSAKLAQDRYTQIEAEKKAKAEADAKKKENDFLAANAKKEGVVSLPDGLQYKVLTAGTGAKPTATDRVTVKYEGKTLDGKVFDSSYKRNPQTTTFGVNQVIKGWTEALQLMPVGSKWELYIPYALAYGERGAGRDIKPYETLIFTVELVDIETTAAAAAPATKTATAKNISAAKKPAVRKVARKK